MTGGGDDLPANGINSHRNKLTAEPTILCFGKPKIRNSWRWQDFSLGISFAKLLKPNFCQANFSKHLEMLLQRWVVVKDRINAKVFPFLIDDLPVNRDDFTGSVGAARPLPGHN